MTSEIVDAPDFRVTVVPTKRNGLRVRSQVMADKPVTVRRGRIRQRTLSEIIAPPDVGPLFAGSKIRRRLLRRFPFGLVYQCALSRPANGSKCTLLMATAYNFIGAA
jgi:hypothetical protein